MGMSIDEAIRYYEDKNVVLTEEEALANTVAIKTMRKYQKIEQAYSDYLDDLDNDDEDDDNAEEKLINRLGEIL